MSKSIINVWDTAYIGPIAVCINQYFNCFIGEYAFFWLFLVSTNTSHSFLIKVQVYVHT